MSFEKTLNKGSDQPTALLCKKAILFDPGIIAVLQCLQRRCISRWSAYAEFLQLFDQARLAITRRWLSEMLIGGNRFLRRPIAFPKARQQLRLFIFPVLDAFLLQRPKTTKKP